MKMIPAGLYYCVTHGDCFIIENINCQPINPCQTQKQCFCELIGNISSEGDLTVLIEGNLEKYFSDKNDGYKVSYLKNLLNKYISM